MIRKAIVIFLAALVVFLVGLFAGAGVMTMIGNQPTSDPRCVNIYATLAVMGYTTNVATFVPVCNKLNEIGSPLLYDCQFLRDMVGTPASGYKACIGTSDK